MKFLQRVHGSILFKFGHKFLLIMQVEHSRGEVFCH